MPVSVASATFFDVTFHAGYMATDAVSVDVVIVEAIRANTIWKVYSISSTCEANFIIRARCAL
jgi:hypothetical protein